jgi:hypothetical protein
MCLVVIFTVTFKHIIFWLLQVIKHFYDICPEHFGGPFLTVLPFRNDHGK